MAEELLKQYKATAKELNINIEEVLLFSKGDYVPYKKQIASVFLREYGADARLINFVEKVPINTGRHTIPKYAISHNINGFYLEAFLGHYISVGVQMGIYSTIDMQEYVKTMRTLTQNIADVYGVTII